MTKLASSVGKKRRLAEVSLSPLAIALLLGLVAGCHAEGHSYLLQASEPRRFASMDACVVEGNAKHEDESQKYAGYVCVHKLLLWSCLGRTSTTGKRNLALPRKKAISQ